MRYIPNGNVNKKWMSRNSLIQWSIPLPSFQTSCYWAGKSSHYSYGSGNNSRSSTGNSDFPEDVEQAESLLLDLGITHILSVSPTHVSSTSLPLPITLHHINVSDNRRDELLVSLPGACLVIQEAIKSGGQVLVHSLVETRACIVVCAYREPYKTPSNYNIYLPLVYFSHADAQNDVKQGFFHPGRRYLYHTLRVPPSDDSDSTSPV